jgi:hypothetical protein
MYQIANHKIKVQQPDRMPQAAGSSKPICPECDQAFAMCSCPKPWSSLETDGYHIIWEDAQIIAYPSLAIYEELMLWIFRNQEHIICGHCLKYVSAEWGWSGEIREKVIEQFFSIHKGCYTGDNIELFFVQD